MFGLGRNSRFTTFWRQIIDNLRADPDLRKRCIRALRKTCGIYGILPTSHVVSFKFTKLQRLFASGRFSDVWRLTDETNQDQVFAVKSLRVYEVDPVERINKV
jgi:adenine specific DNA methylase Mod